MALTRSCSRSFDSATRSRGTAYYYGRCVRIVANDANGLQATVVGSGPAPYDVELDWSRAEREAEVDAYCTCPRYADGHLCKHIWAAILAADARGLAPQLARQPSLIVVHENESDGEPDHKPDDWLDEEFPAGRPRYATPRQSPGPGFAARPPRTRKLDWKQLLAPAVGAAKPGLAAHPPRQLDAVEYDGRGRRHEAWFLLNLTASLERGTLIVDFYQRESRKSGGFGKIKRLSVRRNERLIGYSEEDRQLLQQLLGNTAQNDSSYGSYYYGGAFADSQAYNRCAVSAALQDVLVPRLCGSGRFVWLANNSLPVEEGRWIAWDDGPAWQFRLAVQADDAQRQWTIQGQLVRDAQITPLGDAVLLLSSGLVLFPQALARLDAAADFAWISTLRKHPAITVPYADRGELLKYLCAAPRLPQVDLPANLNVVQVRPEPQGKLAIRAPQRYSDHRYLWANVSFLYGDWTVPWSDGQSAWFDAEQDQLVFRSLDKEQECFNQLTALDIQPMASPSHYTDAPDVRFLHKQLPHVVDRLTAQGWQVESEGKLIRRPGSFHLSVATGIDWFELDGRVDFDGVTASLPSLLKALRNKDKYIRLDDGTHGIMPEEWLKKYGGLADLGQQEEGKLKFAASQALLLDALLAAQENVTVDARFDEYRRKLQSFEGVVASEAPQGFAGSLRGYQKDGLGWLNFLREFRFGGCLADDMGLGKTVQVLAMLESRRSGPLPAGQTRKPSLVVVPKSLVFNWLEEAARFTPQLRVLDYSGLERAALRERFADYDAIVATYGILRRDIVELRKIPLDYAILDESQAIKNANAQAAKACRLLQADHRLAMTGTPVENHLGELWSLFEFLNPGMLGRSGAFTSLTKSGRSRDEDDGTLPLLAHALRPFLLRRTKEQVLSELPEKTEQTLYCEMESKQRKLYDELRDFYRSSLSERVAKLGLAKAKIHVLEALLRLRQAACHPGLIDAKRATEASAKLELLMEQIAEVVSEGHKALIFSQFTSLLAIVRQHLDKHGVVYEYLDGQTRDRKQRVQRFQQDRQCPLFLISLKAGGQGLNLTAADYVYILDPWWNPAVEAQAVDRAHRIGQNRHVFAYRLICRDTVEEKIIELQREKRELADAIVSADNSVIGSLTAEDLQLLLS
ncbi:MAG: helicase SNF2 [Candidatus Anammoximicrobium sp.]|nr:helicase SNF2 [Candidatus Anammoximicrobium sp.]